MTFVLTGASVISAFLATVLERFAGYPAPIYRIVRHPVVWAGALIGFLERALNRGGALRLRGAFAFALVLAAVLAVTVPLALVLRAMPFGVIVEAVLAATLLSQKELAVRIGAVADGLEQGIDQGRAAVSHVVGRDPDTLDEAGVARAAVESLAENSSDGVIAPIFWLVVAGLPGVALYKAVNTADSMIGYRTDRYRDFGWAAARLDDLANWLPARITGWLAVMAAGLAGGDAGGAARTMLRDAGQHVSPNAGWPEAAFAGALGLRLGGPRSYDGAQEDLAWMGDGRAAVSAEDIRRALRLYRRVLDLVAVMLFAAAAFFIRF